MQPECKGTKLESCGQVLFACVCVGIEKGEASQGTFWVTQITVYTNVCILYILNNPDIYEDNGW